MKSIITLFLVLASLTITAKDFYKATITMSDKTVLEGYAELPSNKFLDRSIQFKEEKKGKERKIKNDDISSIVYTNNNGDFFYFERNFFKVIIKPGGNAREKSDGTKLWLVASYSQPSIRVYTGAQEYYFDKKGTLMSVTKDYSGMWAEVGYLFKRPGEDAPTLIGSLTSMGVFNQQKTFRNTAKFYFRDDKEFAKRIDETEFKSEEATELAKAYAEYKAK